MADEVQSALTKYEIVSITPMDIIQNASNQINASPDGRFAAVWNSVPAGQGNVREAQIFRLRGYNEGEGFNGYHHLNNIPPDCTVLEHHCSWADSTTFFMMNNSGLWACLYRYNAGTDSFDVVKEWDIDGIWTISIQCYSSRFNNIIVGAGNSIGMLVQDDVTLTYRFVGMLVIPNAPDWSEHVVCTMYDNYIYVNSPDVAVKDAVLVSVNDWDTSWTILHSFPQTDIMDVYKDKIYLHVSGSGVIRTYILPDLRECGPTIPCIEGQDNLGLKHGKFLTKSNSDTDVHTVYASDTAAHDLTNVIARYKLPSREHGGMPHSFMHGGCWAVCGITLSNMQSEGAVLGNSWMGGRPELYMAVVRMLCTVCGNDCVGDYDGRFDTMCKTCKRWKADVAVAMMRKGGKFPRGPPNSLHLHGLPDDVLEGIFKEAVKKCSSACLALLLI